MMQQPGPSRSRRERPAKPALTRDGIVAAAVEVMRAEGLERVTMRRLAQELDTGPASMYVYLRSTAELHAAVLDTLLENVLGAVDLRPARAARGVDAWRERLVEILATYTRLLFDYPSLARSALIARPSGPSYLNLIEALLSLLHEGGVPDDRAAWGVDLLLQMATATAAEHATRDQAVDAADEQEAFEHAIRSAPAGSHPHVSALASQLLSGPGNDRLTWGFHVLINGMLRTPITHT